MNKHRKCRIRKAATLCAVVAFALALFDFKAQAADPHSAYYSAENNRLFWFIQISDIHIGARGTQDENYLTWIVNDAKAAIEPEFIVASGDLTDSTNGNWLGLPNGPYQAEWDQYKAILAGKVDASDYYDIPGNHDAYNDQYFQYYLANSIQGQATGQMQISWTKVFPFGSYHFLGVNTADNSGDPFSLSWPWGDYAGLDLTELAFIDNQLATHQDAALTLVFGHHPVTATGDDQDTYLYYGAPQFITDLDIYGTSLYGYGHTHRSKEDLFAGDSYTGYMAGDGVFYFNVPSLGKSSDWHYSVVAIDCNGVSSTTQAKGSWPVALITAPADKFLGSAPNPYSYTIPNATNNPIRALAFDVNPITSVRFRINGVGDWHTMTQPRPVENPRLWQGVWDASSLPAGECTIEVQAASSSGTKTDLITVAVEAVSGCGNGTCDVGEDACSCPEDCGTPPAEVCSDGIDNDCDELIDCADSDCNSDPACTGCGNGTCESDEDQCTCPADCGAPPEFETNCSDGLDEDCDGWADCSDPTGECDSDPACLCGNGTCDTGEDCGICSIDCISGGVVGVCGNGVCEPANGEDCVSCSADCAGVQTGKPSGRYCCGDGDGVNPVSCGDARCSASGFSCGTTPSPYCCGDGVCEGAEDSFNCQIDCGLPPACATKKSPCTEDSDCCSNRCSNKGVCL
jgi:predicted MPP superfamily phosphohydrolase